MHRILAAVTALCLASPTFADAPSQGSFGIGAEFGGAASFGAANIATFNNGLNGRYFVTQNVLLSAGLGLVSTENVGTQFSIAGGCAYYFMREPGRQLSPFVGGALGVISSSPTNQDSKTGVLFLLGGGLEYFFNKSFGMQVTEGLQLSTNPTNFAFVTRLGVNLYF